VGAKCIKDVDGAIIIVVVYKKILKISQRNGPCESISTLKIGRTIAKSKSGKSAGPSSVGEYFESIWGGR